MYRFAQQLTQAFDNAFTTDANGNVTIRTAVTSGGASKAGETVRVSYAEAYADALFSKSGETFSLQIRTV